MIVFGYICLVALHNYTMLLAMFQSPWLAGLRDTTLQRLGKCAGSTDANTCRNLHRLLKSPKFTLPVKISNAMIGIRDARTRRIKTTPWPLMKLSDWAKHILEDQGGTMSLSSTISSGLHRFRVYKVVYINP